MATTISVTDEQRAELESRKVHDKESMKDVIGRLLGDDPSADGESIPRSVEADTEPTHEQLERIESSVQTIESRTGSIESILEDVR